MITPEQQHHWFQQQVAPEADGQQTTQKLRQAATQALADLPALHHKQEAWRYNRAYSLFEHDYTASPGNRDQISCDELAKFATPLDTYRIWIVNGIWQSASETDTPQGVTIVSMKDALSAPPQVLAGWLESSNRYQNHLFLALNTAKLNDGYFVHIDANVELDKPIEIVTINGGGSQIETMSQTTNIVQVDSNAKIDLIERFIGLGEQHYFHNNQTEITVGDNATLNHYRIQNENSTSHHLSSLFINQHQNSHYKAMQINIGSRWSKSDFEVDFQQPDANCELLGLYVVGDNQLSDIHLNVLHKAPQCKSTETFKGVLHGKARGVFDGRILVGKDAQHSDAALKNDNLLLTRDAEVDTKPVLEIYADNVKCSHGTTVGQLDPQKIFYLRSRGINEQSARHMLSLGFAQEILDQIPHEQLRDYVTDSVQQHLSQLPEITGEQNGS